MRFFTDTHCHLDFEALSQDLNATLNRAAKSNVTTIVVPSIGPTNWQDVLNLPSKYQGIQIMPCLGLHPWFLANTSLQTLERLRALIIENLNRLPAIGEAGIDGKIAEEQGNLSWQIEVFEYQLALANEVKKPIIVHHRKSHPKIAESFKRVKPEYGGVIHAFSGSFQQAKTYLDLGFKIGIGGTITYERAAKTINTVKKLPLESLVLETDAPAMPLNGMQGAPNEPQYISKVFDALANIREESRAALANQIDVNARQLFSSLHDNLDG
ncbi:TatD family hydrolase [Thalassotalea euphylliae]|uniref:TatD family hydrolase n=1 Tax=Thalassotalea euphylliae TaxID=1655234 RepID=UPI0036381DB0